MYSFILPRRRYEGLVTKMHAKKFTITSNKITRKKENGRPTENQQRQKDYVYFTTKITKQ